MSFFDDEPPPEEPQPRRPRPKTDRNKLKFQRLAILLVALFVIVLALAFGVRECRQNAKEAAYREYFTAVQETINDSNDVGKKLGTILANPGKYKRQELTDELTRLENSHEEIAERAQNTEPPDKLKDLHETFALGMKVRWHGVTQVKNALLSAVAKKNSKAMAAKLAALSGYFTGPDVYYVDQYQTQAQTVMTDDGVGGIAVPASDFFLKHDLFDAAAIEAALKRAAASTSLTGTHGVGLVSVVAKPDGVRLKAGDDTQVQSAPDLVFAVTIQNQGSVTENDVVVKLTFTAPGGSPQELKGTISAIGPGERQSVDIGGVVIPPEALAKTSTVKVLAGPVEGEKVTDNNQATYGVILQFE